MKLKNYDGSAYRYSRWRTSSGQSQTLWTFIVIIAVAVSGFLSMNTSGIHFFAPSPSMTQSEVIANHNLSSAKDEKVEQLVHKKSTQSSSSVMP